MIERFEWFEQNHFETLKRLIYMRAHINVCVYKQLSIVYLDISLSIFTIVILKQ